MKGRRLETGTRDLSWLQRFLPTTLTLPRVRSFPSTVNTGLLSCLPTPVSTPLSNLFPSLCLCLCLCHTPGASISLVRDLPTHRP